MSKKEKALKIIKIIYLLLIIIFLVSFVFIIRYKWGVFLAIVGFISIIVLYFVIHFIHKKIYNYTCPSCHQSFQIDIFKDITSYNVGSNAKILICPYCKTKEVMKASLKQ